MGIKGIIEKDKFNEYAIASIEKKHIPIPNNAIIDTFSDKGHFIFCLIHLSDKEEIKKREEERQRLAEEERKKKKKKKKKKKRGRVKKKRKKRKKEKREKKMII